MSIQIQHIYHISWKIFLKNNVCLEHVRGYHHHTKDTFLGRSLCGVAEVYLMMIGPATKIVHVTGNTVKSHYFHNKHLNVHLVGILSWSSPQ